jgi:glycosyltransferase involved in cell wall biosynthesis
MRQLSISIGVCTRNRAAMLRTSLYEIRALMIPAGLSWEVLVVDNGSTDDTPTVLELFSTSLPLRVLRLETPGKSHALNYAIAHARSDYMLWTDDDVLVDRQWVVGYLGAFRRWPDAAFFGGPIEPLFEATPPPWLATHWQRVANVFAVRQLGEDEFSFDNQRLPYGANFAVKTSVQRGFLYDPSLGPQPGSEVRGEETQVIRKMLAAGHTGWWVPAAKVRHIVPKHRQSVAYVRQFFIGQGEVQSREFTNANVSRTVGWRLRLWKRAITAEARYRWRRATASPKVWLDALIEAAVAWGRLKAL